VNLRYSHLVSGASQSDIYRSAGKAAVVLVVVFLILAPVYLFSDQLISTSGYSVASRHGTSLWIAYFIFAAACLLALPKALESLQPFERSTAFALYTLCLAANVGALLLVVAVAK